MIDFRTNKPDLNHLLEAAIHYAADPNVLWLIDRYREQIEAEEKINRLTHWVINAVNDLNGLASEEGNDGHNVKGVAADLESAIRHFNGDDQCL